MTQCPHCGFRQEESGAVFCVECGKPALEDARKTIHNTEAATVFEKVSVTPPPFVENASNLGTGKSDAPQAYIITSDRSPPIHVEFNRNRFYMQGKDGVLEFRLTGRPGRPPVSLEFVVSRASGGFIGRGSAQLATGAVRPISIPFSPDTSGEVLLDIRVVCRGDGRANVFAGQSHVRVLEPTTTPQNLSISVSTTVTAGESIYGQSIRNQASDLLRSGQLRTNNDLLEREFTDDWRIVEVFHDSEQSERETHASAARVHVVRGLQDRKVKNFRASWNSDSTGKTCVTLLLGMPEVRLGRRREENDVVLRVLPRDTENDRLSGKISRRHLAILARPQGPVLVRTTHGELRLDGEMIATERPIPLERVSVVDVAGAMKLRITPICSGGESIGDIDYSQLGEPDECWRWAQGIGLLGLRIERVDNQPDTERYLVIYRWVPVVEYGTPEPRDAQPPAAGMRIVRMDHQFWLHNRAAAGSVTVGGVAIPIGSAGRLAPGATIRFPDATIAFAEFRQFGL